ncbi:MAG: imidazolonepropionase [Bacteroidia bacterium]|nr:imidazolonepropionase [Bacteroidia bacterium]MDW8302392.1 imidazolonepropionase [Bacteroidia bacterium]
MYKVFTNIKKLYTVADTDTYYKKGISMQEPKQIENAYLRIHKNKVVEYGTMQDLQMNEFEEVVDVTGKIVFPTFCDSHTHIVYAGTREQEFVYKIQGLTYQEIAAKGGGILNSAAALQNTSEKVLYQEALQRLQSMIARGTGAVEIKSGYGLTVESELKMLRVIAMLKESVEIPVKATFLGAHAIPSAYKNNRQAYIRLIIEEMLPNIAEEKLADYIDVFCDEGFFTAQETDLILEAGAKYGLKPKIHANELSNSGGVQVGVKYKAISVDHLEHTTEQELECLLHSDTVATLLPSTAFFLGLKYPDARRMIDKGLCVALASDYNPGSSPSGNMSFVISLACIQMHILPEEALTACTLNGAYAMEISHLGYGKLCPNGPANFVVTKPCQSLAAIPYHFGDNLIEQVWIEGKRLA